MSTSTKETGIKIETGVPVWQDDPLPPFPLGEMEVGQSFVLSLQDENQKRTVRQRLSRFQSNNPPQRFVMKTTKEDKLKVRVHRVEDYK